MNPTVLILGATSDMATALARKYAQEGYSIQLAARKVEAISSLKTDLEARANVSVSTHAFDALQQTSHVAFWEALPVKPDVVICVFGYLGDQNLAVREFEESNQIMQTNYNGAVSILNVVTKAFEERKSGTIIGISSVAGDRGRQSNYIYGSAKAGFTAYLSGLRNHLFHFGVHVLTVQPGFVYTRMTENLTLPPLLTARPEQVAQDVFNAAKKQKNVIYTRWFWRYIMLIIRNIPEFIFKKLKL